MSDELDELRELQVDADLTALVLRDVARHLARGDLMGHNGEWRPAGDFVDHSATLGGSRERRGYRRGRQQATTDAVCALTWIADANSRRGLR